jgi:O-antigen/teichoic acid export membrane protein
VPAANTGEGRPKLGDSKPATTGNDGPAATADGAGALQPRAFSPENKQWRQAVQPWAEEDVAVTNSLPGVSPISPHLARRPGGNAAAATGGSAWFHTEGPPTPGTGELSAPPHTGVPPAGRSGAAGLRPLFRPRPNVSGPAAGQRESVAQQRQSAAYARERNLGRRDGNPAATTGGAAWFHTEGPPTPGTEELSAPPHTGVPPAGRSGAAGARPLFRPRPNVSGPAAGQRESVAQQRQSTVPPRQPVAAQHQSAAYPRNRDLARRSCLRVRCVCADPTVCPAIAVKPAAVTDGFQLGRRMPAQGPFQPPGSTTLMSLAVASAATMPIPIVPGAPRNGFVTIATIPLPAVSADAPKLYTDASPGHSPVAKLLARLRSDHMLRNTLFLILSTGLQAALGFAFWIVVARLFSPADVGRGSSLISAIGLIAYLALLGLNSAVVRYLPTAEDPDSLITATVLLVGGCGALLGAIYIFVTPVLAPKVAFVAHQPLLALGFVLLSAATTVNLLTDSVFIASRKASYTALTDGGIGGSAKIAFSVAVVGAGAYGVFSASAGGFAAAAVASLILMVTALHWRPSLKKPVEILKPLIKFSFANYAGNVMSLLPTLVVPLIILDRIGASSAAYYFVAFQLANLLYAAANAVEQTFLAEGSQADVDWRGLLRRSLRLLVTLFLPMCLIVVVSAHWVLLAFGVKYSQYGTLSLMLLAAAAVPIGANDWLQTVLRLAGALPAIVWSGVVSAVSICTAAWFLAPFGLTALTASWPIGSALGAMVAGIGFVVVRRRELPHRHRHRLVGPASKARGRAPSAYKGRHVPRPAKESQSERSKQPVG